MPGQCQKVKGGERILAHQSENKRKIINEKMTFARTSVLQKKQTSRRKIAPRGYVGAANFAGVSIKLASRHPQRMLHMKLDILKDLIG